MTVLFGSTFGFYLGFALANKYPSNLREDNEQFLTEFINEDNMFYTIYKTKKPILFYYYVPGEWFSIKFREHFLQQAKKHHTYIYYLAIVIS
jgi:hypothetical protein